MIVYFGVMGNGFDWFLGFNQLVHGEEVAESAKGLEEGVDALGAFAGAVDAAAGLARLLGDDYGVDAHHAGELLLLLGQLIGEAMLLAAGHELVGDLCLFDQAEDALLALVDVDGIEELLGGPLLLLTDAQLQDALLGGLAVHLEVQVVVSHRRRLCESS